MIVILNAAAGGSSKSARDSDKAIRELFAASNSEVRIMRPNANNDLSKIVHQAAEDPDQVVVAGGGDGTVSAVAGALAGSGKTLGVLPMGTLNHFAKDLGLPL